MQEDGQGGVCDLARFVLTEYGKIAVNMATSGGTKITITAVKTSDSTSLTTDTYPDFTSIGQTVPPSSISYKSDVGTALVTAVFTNTALSQAYTIRAVGLYAKCAGDYTMSTARLFGYCILDSADSMPLPTSEPISYTYQLNTKVADTETITIELIEGAYASATDFYELTNLVHNNEANSITVRLNSTAASTERGGYNWLQEVAVQGMTNEYWVDATISSGTFNGSYAVESATDKLRLWFVTKPATSVYLKVIYFPTYN